ncbi:hypothetical protein DRO59_07575 [Candidatus Bathyarchaeota archaeon]|nr:MAG: hypothetical protein DRO59_07575 [Candidatus Bathyarchaeota archaeon]
MDVNPRSLRVSCIVTKWPSAILMGLLVSHATELMRQAEGLDVSNFKRHHGYIPPKPKPRK